MKKKAQSFSKILESVANRTKSPYFGRVDSVKKYLLSVDYEFSMESQLLYESATLLNKRIRKLNMSRGESA